MTTWEIQPDRVGPLQLDQPLPASLRADLDQLIEALDDPRSVTDVLARGNEGARALPSKRGKSPDEVVAVVVEIPDTPGALGQLFADVTAHGVCVAASTVGATIPRTLWVPAQGLSGSHCCCKRRSATAVAVLQPSNTSLAPRR